MKKFLKDYLFYIIVGTLIVLRLTNVFVVNIVSGSSMMPNFKEGELVIGTCLKGDLQRGDIIVATPNNSGVKYVIKRVVGLPDEHIVLEDGYIFVNGEKIEETYVEDSRMKMSRTVRYEFYLKDNEYLICGDNRDNSYDGRNYGPLKEDQIVQKIIFRLT